jgi:hypothetical protein
MHFRSPHKSEAVTADHVGDRGKEIGHRRFLGSKPALCGHIVGNATHTGRSDERAILNEFVIIRY